MLMNSGLNLELPIAKAASQLYIFEITGGTIMTSPNFLVFNDRMCHRVTISRLQQKVIWKSWRSKLNVIETFLRLSSLGELTNSYIKIIENFVALMYKRTCPHGTVN